MCCKGRGARTSTIYSTIDTYFLLLGLNPEHCLTPLLCCSPSITFFPPLRLNPPLTATSPSVNLFQQFLPQVLGFMELIANDQAREDSVLRGAVGLVGDLVQRMGPAVKPLVHHQAVKRLLHQASLSRNPSTQQTAQWATGLIKQVV